MCVHFLLNNTTEEYILLYFQSNDYWLIVHNLKSLSDGGILDPDDLLVDVADDREQVDFNHVLYMINEIYLLSIY